MSTRFTLHFDSGELRVVAHELSVKGAVKVYAVSVGGEQYVLKFTTAFDVDLHHAILADHRTRDYVVPLLGEIGGSALRGVSGRAAWSRRPYKLMKRYSVGQLHTTAAIAAARVEAINTLAAVHGLPVPGDWMRAGNVLNDGVREYYFDFDAEEGQLVDESSSDEVEVLGPPAARSAFLQLQQRR